jgi:hypothetical protein
MATQVQFRRGTTTQNNAFTGAAGEITYDTDIKTLRLHDGTSAGGGAVVATLSASQTLLNKTHSTGSVWNGQVIGLQYGGTGGSITPSAGAIIYSSSSGMNPSASGTSGQVLISGGSSAPSWVASTSLQAGNSVNSTYATNIAGGSAGQLLIQQDSSLTTFITAGDAGTFLKSAGAGYAPTWANGQVTYGSTTVAFGGTSTSIAGLTAIDATIGATSFFATPTGTVALLGAATNLTLGNSATTVSIGNNTSATLTLRPGTVVGSNTTQNLYNTVATTVNAFGASTATSVGASTGTHTINNSGFIHNSSNYTKVAVGTTDQRPGGISGNVGTAAVGMIRYNSTISSYEGFASGNWSSLGGVKSVDAFTYIQAETSAGASNGDLDFFAENTAGTAAIQVGQWNRTNLKDYTGTLVGTQTTQNVFNATATTINLGGAATTLSIGAATGTATVNNTTLAAKAITASTTLGVTGNATVGGTLGVTGATTLSSTLGVTGNTTVGGTLGVTGLITSTAGISGGPATHTTGSFSSTLGVTGATTLSSTLGVTGITSITNSTQSSATTNGALVVTGGAGIGGHLYVGGTITVSGNLSVSGTTTTTNSQSLTVTTPQLFLASDNAANTTDVGILGGYTTGGTAKKTGLVKQASSGEWRLFSNTTAAPGTTYDFTGAVYDTMRLGTAILTDTTASSSTTTGALRVSGGAGIAGAAYVGGVLNVAGATTLSSALTYGGVTLSNSVTGTGSMVLSASPSITGTLAAANITASGTLSVSSTSSFTGAITATGGVTGNLTGNTTGTHTGAVVGNASTASAWATARTLSLTGDATASLSVDGSAAVSSALTLATVNSNVGAFGSTTAVPIITVDAKGRITAVSTAAISATASSVNINYNNDSNSTYQMLWGSGSAIYGTGGIYCNPASDVVYASGFQVASDLRLKSNVQDSNYGLSEVLQLRSVQYDRNENHEIGLIAQEVETVLPEFVKEGQDGIKSVNYSQMVSVLIKAVQELSAEVESLKKQLG